MAGQYPGHSHHNFYNDWYDLNTAASQTSGDTGQVTTQSFTGDDAMMAFANSQYPPSGNDHLTPNYAVPLPRPPPGPAHQAEMAESLNNVGSLFDNQPTGDTAYASPDALSTAVDGAQDTPSHVAANTPATADGQPPNQRRPRARPPDPEVWDHYKTAIHSFYMEQNFTLAATMQLMIRHHQFHATEKMYKDKFKQWKWSKNLPKAIAARMLNIANQRRPKRTFFRWNNRIWPIERIKKLLSRHSAEEDSSIQEDSSIPDDFSYGTLPSSGITDNQSILENSHGNDGDIEMADAATADTTEDLRKFLNEGFCRINSSPEALHSRVQEAAKAAEEDTCNYEDVESAFRDAFSYYRHNYSPTHNKTLEVGYLLATFYAKRRRVNGAHCMLDWMTKEHCGDTKSCNARTVTHVLSTIAILRQTKRDEEANALTIRLLKHHQSPKAEHLLLQSFSNPCVWSNEMIEDLLASSESELATMSNILERLSTDSSNHRLLQDLLPRYIQKCDQPTLEKQAIHSRCIFAAMLVKKSQFGTAINILKEGERLLNPFLTGNIDSQCPLELSTLTLARRLAFTFGDANDPDACLRVLSTALEHMDCDEVDDHSYSVCDFLMSTASGLHSKGSCERSHAWMNKALSTSRTLFGDTHQCTKQIQEVMITCDMDIFFGE